MTYILQVEGGETTSPVGTEAIELDSGTTSTYIQMLNLVCRKLRETGGPTPLSMGAITDGQLFKRSGTSIIGATANETLLTFTDITTLNMTTSLHGLQAKGDNNATHFYRSDASQTVTPLILYLGMQLSAPADATTYYFGLPTLAVATTTAQNRKHNIQRAGTITIGDVVIHNNGGTQGSNETSTISIRKNDTTDTSITTSLVANAASAASTFSLNNVVSVSLVATDYIEIKWVTPTWATNPTNVFVQVALYMN